jgi:glycosyltransferase involved in cell wall biosynthesis
MPQSLKISFVLPIYNESKNIPKLFSELEKVTDKLKTQSKSVELIFVDDGSSDDSFLELQKIYNENPKEIKIISFSRNYGHQIAVTAGQDHASGDAVIIMDSDLQDPPSVCHELIKKWESGYDIVYAKRRSYKTNFIKKWTAYFFYRILKVIAGVDIPVDTGDFRLLSKRVNLEMQKYSEKSRYLRGISSLIGFKSTSVLFDRSERFAGKPAYTFTKSLNLAIDGITGFSLFPLKLISFLGLFFASFSFLIGFLYIVFTTVSGQNISGWASLMSVTIFMGGVQMMMLGIIGEYIGRIYIQSLNRPLYTVDKFLADTEKSK